MPCKKSNGINFGMFFAASGAARVSSTCCPIACPFFTEHDAVKRNAVMVTLGEMKNCEAFRFIADGADPPA